MLPISATLYKHRSHFGSR